MIFYVDFGLNVEISIDKPRYISKKHYSWGGYYVKMGSYYLCDIKSRDTTHSYAYSFFTHEDSTQHRDNTKYISNNGHITSTAVLLKK